MRMLRCLHKWWHELWSAGSDWTMGIDSHRWESKIEISRCLSSVSH